MSSITLSQPLWKASKYYRANNWSSHVWESRFSNRYILQGVVFMQVERCVPGNSLYQNRTTIKSATRQTPIDTDRQNNWSPKDHHVLWFHFHHQSISTEYPVSIHCTILSAVRGWSLYNKSTDFALDSQQTFWHLALPAHSSSNTVKLHSPVGFLPCATWLILSATASSSPSVLDWAAQLLPLVRWGKMLSCINAASCQPCRGSPSTVT